ncbi:acyltransferase [Catenovulum sp. 2E275]|uniref:acyltransferase n=1 Tax=Catenovulum sp. 2E275 TaxID=2980497 RepID=UPI0021CF13AD|nr:acyltransferase [Catenovulum sp. 2E275]MCU4675543.1 acyltransferase [Catenovulum sp. 2E275]
MKLFIKKLYLFITFLFVLPLIILFRLAPTTLKNSLFFSFSQLLSLFPGQTGSYIRVSFYHSAMSFCARDTRIHFATIFSQPDTEINCRVYIGPQCNIGSCIIGADSLIASGVHILSGKNQHNFSDLNTPIQQQGGHYQKIKIGQDCWVGNGAIIMADIGDKCIVAAGSVVTKKVPDFSIVAGNPAKIIRSRKDESIF